MPVEASRHEMYSTTQQNNPPYITSAVIKAYRNIKQITNVIKCVCKLFSLVI